ncbi:PREDICTED: multifunctional methyltransferase subunit TRM112-like protein [Polistes dominula]|uniref:Multifunctional methyltransferase subunit TRM112-like protein n=1 Tax=Polistes dominula TaxID=743375 RepID=A0ABM1IGU9_POLDO|nr:PREDICTED: multifunctional methyltransferase subunit TRM112-like protein [Polistes dominula]
MKLITHNMLTSQSLKGVTVGYPLGIIARDVRIAEIDFNPEFIIKIIPKLDWPALWRAAESIGHADIIPKELQKGYDKDIDFLKQAHHALFEIDVVSGDLLCPESGRRFPINDGIPNMLLNEDEVNN